MSVESEEAASKEVAQASAGASAAAAKADEAAAQANEAAARAAEAAARLVSEQTATHAADAQAAAQRATEAANSAAAQAAATEAAAAAARAAAAKGGAKSGGVGAGDEVDDVTAMWEAAAAELTPVKSLERVTGHQQAVLDRVGLVGTLLTGLGAVTAAVTVTRDTYTVQIADWDVPVIPVGALASTVLGALAVMVALIARRPRFKELNPQDLQTVRDWFNDEIKRGKWLTLVASWLLLAAAAVAAATGIAAGAIIINDPDPSVTNQATLSVTTGDDGNTGHLGGSLEGVNDEEAVVVIVGYCATVTSPANQPPCESKSGIPNIPAKNRLSNATAYPDADGAIAFDLDITGVPAGLVLAAIIEVHSVVDGRVIDTYNHRFALTALPPTALKPAKPSGTASGSPAPSTGPSTRSSASASTSPAKSTPSAADSAL